MAGSVTGEKFNTEFTKVGTGRSRRQRCKADVGSSQSLRYSCRNLHGAGRIAMDADGLRADCDFAPVAGKDEALFNDAQGLAAGFGGIVDQGVFLFS